MAELVGLVGDPELDGVGAGIGDGDAERLVFVAAAHLAQACLGALVFGDNPQAIYGFGGQRHNAAGGKNVGRAADARRGELLFDTHCALCHEFRGEGGKIGPSLTGIGAATPASGTT